MSKYCRAKEEENFGITSSPNKILREKMIQMFDKVPSKYNGVYFQKCDDFDEAVIDPQQVVKRQNQGFLFMQEINGLLQLIIIILNCLYASSGQQLYSQLGFGMGCLSQLLLFKIHMEKYIIQQIQNLQMKRISRTNQQKNKQKKEIPQEQKVSQNVSCDRQQTNKPSIIYNSKLNSNSKQGLSPLKRSSITTQLNDEQQFNLTSQLNKQNSSITQRRTTSLLSAVIQMRKSQSRANSAQPSPKNAEVMKISSRKGSMKTKNKSSDQEIRTLATLKTTQNVLLATSNAVVVRKEKKLKKKKKQVVQKKYQNDEMVAIKNASWCSLMRQLNYQYIQYLINILPLMTIGITEQDVLRNVLLLQLFRAVFLIDLAIAYQRVEFTHQYSLYAKYNLHMNAFKFVTFSLCFIIMIFSFIYSVIEESEYVWDSIWNVIVSITTIGYGDIVPVTDSGRALIILCSTLGVIFLSFIASMIQSSQEFTHSQQISYNQSFLYLQQEQLQNEAQVVFSYYFPRILKIRKHNRINQQQIIDQDQVIINVQNNASAQQNNKGQQTVQNINNRLTETDEEKAIWDAKLAKLLARVEEREDKRKKKNQSLFKIQKHYFFMNLQAKNAAQQKTLEQQNSLVVRNQQQQMNDNRLYDFRLDLNNQSNFLRRNSSMLSKRRSTLTIPLNMLAARRRPSINDLQQINYNKKVQNKRRSIENQLSKFEKNIQLFCQFHENIRKAVIEIDEMNSSLLQQKNETAEFSQKPENNQRIDSIIVQETPRDIPKEENISTITNFKTMTFQAATQRSLNASEIPAQVPAPFILNFSSNNDDYSSFNNNKNNNIDIINNNIDSCNNTNNHYNNYNNNNTCNNSNLTNVAQNAQILNFEEMDYSSDGEIDNSDMKNELTGYPSSLPTAKFMNKDQEENFKTDSFQQKTGNCDNNCSNSNIVGFTERYLQSNPKFFNDLNVRSDNQHISNQQLQGQSMSPASINLVKQPKIPQNFCYEQTDIDEIDQTEERGDIEPIKNNIPSSKISENIFINDINSSQDNN